MKKSCHLAKNNEYLLSFVVRRLSFVVCRSSLFQQRISLYSVSVAVCILYSVLCQRSGLYSVLCQRSVRRNAGLTSQRFSHTFPRIDPVRLFVPVYPSIYSGIVE